MSEFNTPWGNYNITTSLGLLDMVIAQLEHYLETNQSPDRDSTIRCLHCYRNIKAFGCEQLAARFFELRTQKRKGIESCFEMIREENQEFRRWGDSL